MGYGVDERSRNGSDQLLVGRQERDVPILLLDPLDGARRRTGVAPEVDALEGVGVVLDVLLGPRDVLEDVDLLGADLDIQVLRVRTHGSRPHEVLVGTEVIQRAHALQDQLVGGTETTVLVEDTELGHVPRPVMLEALRQMARLMKSLQELLHVVGRLLEGQRAAEADQLTPLLEVLDHHDETVTEMWEKYLLKNFLGGVRLVVRGAGEGLLVHGDELLLVRSTRHHETHAPVPGFVRQRTTSISLLRTTPSSVMSAEMVISDG